MSKLFKRLLAVVLAAMLVLGVGAVGASAETSGDFTYTVTDGKTTITGYTGSATSLTIPATLGGYPVTSIGNIAFYGCNSLTSVIIPTDVTSIGNGAFSNCNSLKSIIIPNGVKSMGNLTFSDCISLVSIIIPSSVTSIGNNMFAHCTSLTSITIPDKVTSIGEYAFYDCNSLASITIPDGVRSIGDYTFYDCTSLVSVVIPEDVTSIGWFVFTNCTSLTSIFIPNSVTSIHSSAFENCPALTAHVVENSYAHAYCVRINIPYDFDPPTPFTATDPTTGIVLEAAAGVLSVGTQLIVTEQPAGNFSISDGTLLTVFDITLKNGTENVQPSGGKVTVKLPIPAGTDPSKLEVYHIDGSTKTPMTILDRSNGYLVFQTDHFSIYAVVKSDTTTPDPDPDPDPADTKEHFKLWGKTTKWEKTPLNWFLCIVLFGWIWMAF